VLYAKIIIQVMHKFLYFGSYLVFPFILFLGYYIYSISGKIYGKKIRFSLSIFLIILSLIFIYSRFIEKNMIVIKYSKVNTGFQARVVVISDMHIGEYNNSHFLDRIVGKINSIENVDAVLIPGDFTYYPEGDLTEMFTPLSKLKYPVYAVLGNHDSEQPGPFIRDKLQAALEANNVKFLHNQAAELESKNIKILGLGDRWAGEDDVSKLNDFNEDDNLLVITHNPDTAMKYKSNNADLTVSGHTHGGQIRVPFFYKSQIPSKYEFDQGLYEVEYSGNEAEIKDENTQSSSSSVGQVYVTSGLGVVGLPMRLGVPPVIDVLDLR
jgi:predicted MPP superfamily phosphohydrolase